MGAPLFDLDDDGVSGDSADFHPFRQFITVRHNFQYVVLLLSFPYVHLLAATPFSLAPPRNRALPYRRRSLTDPGPGMKSSRARPDDADDTDAAVNDTLLPALMAVSPSAHAMYQGPVSGLWQQPASAQRDAGCRRHRPEMH
jgi:hypothetical protein